MMKGIRGGEERRGMARESEEIGKPFRRRRRGGGKERERKTCLLFLGVEISQSPKFENFSSVFPFLSFVRVTR